MDKVIIYGIGKRCEKILKVFPNLVKYVEIFVDAYSDEKVYWDKEVKTPEILRQEAYRTKRIVVTPANRFDEISEFLRREYQLQGQQLIPLQEWL